MGYSIFPRNTADSLLSDNIQRGSGKVKYACGVFLFWAYDFFSIFGSCPQGMVGNRTCWGMDNHSKASFGTDDQSRVSRMVSSRIGVMDMAAVDMAAVDMVVMNMAAIDMTAEDKATVDKAMVAMTDMLVNKTVVDSADMVVDSIS